MLTITSHADTALEAVGNAIAFVIVLAGYWSAIVGVVLTAAAAVCAPIALIWWMWRDRKKPEPPRQWRIVFADDDKEPNGA